MRRPRQYKFPGGASARSLALERKRQREERDRGACTHKPFQKFVFRSSLSALSLSREKCQMFRMWSAVPRSPTNTPAPAICVTCARDVVVPPLTAMPYSYSRARIQIAEREASGDAKKRERDKLARVKGVRITFTTERERERKKVEKKWPMAGLFLP